MLNDNKIVLLKGFCESSSYEAHWSILAKLSPIYELMIFGQFSSMPSHWERIIRNKNNSFFRSFNRRLNTVTIFQFVIRWNLYWFYDAWKSVIPTLSKTGISWTWHSESQKLSPKRFDSLNNYEIYVIFVKFDWLIDQI